jgi:hypothetical protein
MPDDTLLIRSLRAKRVKNVQTVQHLGAALILITAALPHLDHTGTTSFYFALAEVVAAVTLFGSVVVEKLNHHRKRHSRIGWVEVAGGLMLYVEALGKTREAHHVVFYFLQFVPALILLLFGLFEPALSASHYLKATDRNLMIRLRPFWWRAPAWGTLTGYRITPKHLELDTTSGKIRRIRIKDIENREEADAWLNAQMEKRGVAKLG